MKKLFLTIVCVLLMTTVALADVVFYNSNQVTLEWSAVTTDVDGDAIAGVTYKLYLANADTDPNKTNPVVAADNITGTSTTITLGAKGRYYVGCQAVLGDLVSDINWADELENQATAPLIGLRFAVPPNAPKNIKK